jgi:hypothetical protein
METILEADQSMHIWTKFVFISFSIVLIKVPMAQTYKAGQHVTECWIGIGVLQKA